MRHSAQGLCPGRRRWAAALGVGLGSPVAWGWPGPAGPSPGTGGRRARVQPKPPPPAAPPVPLPAEVAAAIDAAGLARDGIGLLALPLAGTPVPLLQLNDTLPLQLASTAKLITTFAALDLLGPGYRWRTEARLRGPLSDGRLLGDLVIVGGGDALLQADDLQAWFERMGREGLREVWGDIVIDHSRFRLEDADLARTPEPAPERPHHAWPAALWVQPREPRLSSPGSAPLSPALDDGTARLVLSLWRAAGRKLRGRVVDRRETVRGGVTEGLAPAWSQHVSPPLALAVREINKRSDNPMSRQLMMSLSPGFPEQPATLAAARARLENWLRLQGLPEGEAMVDSGSGLARTERASPRALVALLRNAQAHPQSATFIDSLPIAGVDGTLQGRLLGSPARGHAWLKTGSLLDTKALAGYVRDRRSRLHAVALLAQHPPGHERAAALLEAVVDWIARQA